MLSGCFFLVGPVTFSIAPGSLPANNMQVKQLDHSGVGGVKESDDKEWRNMPGLTATQCISRAVKLAASTHQSIPVCEGEGEGVFDLS